MAGLSVVQLCRREREREREWIPSASVATPTVYLSVMLRKVPCLTSHQFESKKIQKFPGWLQNPWVIVIASLLQLLIMMNVCYLGDVYL